MSGVKGTKISVVITASNPDMTKEQQYELEKVIGTAFMALWKQLLPVSIATGELIYDHGDNSPIPETTTTEEEV
jgi:hypothetical protein